MRQHNPPIEVVRSILAYDSSTGLLTWRRNTAKRIQAGRVAGGLVNCGYVMIPVQGRKVAAHRVAWAIHYGQWPAQQIDHINRDKADNRIANLRQATPEQNMGNTKLHTKNTSGFRGVCRSTDMKKWTAYIKENGRRVRLGTHPTAEAASAAYEARAKAKFGEYYLAP